MGEKYTLNRLIELCELFQFNSSTARHIIRYCLCIVLANSVHPHFSYYTFRCNLKAFLLCLPKMDYYLYSSIHFTAHNINDLCSALSFSSSSALLPFYSFFVLFLH